MNNTHEANRYQLARRELLTLEHAQGLVIECTTGSLWITVEGGAGDTLLNAGESLRLAAKARVFISALQAAQLVARPCCGDTPIRRIGARCAAVLLSRLERWRHLPLAGYPAAWLR